MALLTSELPQLEIESLHHSQKNPCWFYTPKLATKVTPLLAVLDRQNLRAVNLAVCAFAPQYTPDMLLKAKHHFQ